VQLRFSELVAKRANIRHLNQPAWCNGWAHRNFLTCASLYGPLSEGSVQLAPRVRNPADDNGEMHSSLVCIEDRVEPQTFNNY
jgi:hypothetical protein